MHAHNVRLRRVRARVVEPPLLRPRARERARKTRIPARYRFRLPHPSESVRLPGDGLELATELRSCAGGKGEGVFATSHFEVGETVMDGVVGEPVDRNDVHANQVSPTQWVREGGVHEKLNHSCDPSCGVRVNASGRVDYVARRRIDVGDEITFDYAMRNYVVEHVPARCLCGSTECRGTITGWRDLPAERKAAYRGFVAPYLLELDRNRPTSPVPARA